MLYEIEEMDFGEDFGLPEVAFEPLPDEIEEVYLVVNTAAEHPLMYLYKFLVLIWQNALA